MSFATLSALLIAALVAAPVVAHMLRRLQAEERPFPAAHLVPPTPPTARRRSMLEDRALFGVRAAAVLLLAVLGATPFVRCSRLSLTRRSGASVALAIVMDDSLSMRARLPGGPTRWAKALSAARELSAGLAPGDAVAIVLAGAPARVALGSTTNMAAVSEALSGLGPSDRATDLDGAVSLGKGLLRGLPQRDKRVVLFSDLADGSPADAPPLAGDAEIAVWVPVPELVASGHDCAVTRADRAGTRVRARVTCASTDEAKPAASGEPKAEAPGPSAGRKLEIRSGKEVLGSAPLPANVRSEEIVVEVPASAPALLRAVLTGSDDIAEDDEAPVVASGGALPMAVVVDAATTHVATGGPPPIEQAFAALELDAQIHPLPAVPEQPDDLKKYAALIVDDVPGFTPELRRTLAAWVERGGVALLTLGPRAAAAPLGAGFDPLVPGVVRWGASPSPGIDAASAPTLGPSAEGLADLAPKGRASLDPEALARADVLARWSDGAPLLLRRSLGRGAVLALTLPLSAEESDLVLRPAFLALLDRFVGSARARGGARRIDVGESWTFDGYRAVEVKRVSLGEPAPPVPLRIQEESEPSSAAKPTERRLRAAPGLAGLYELTLDGEPTTRVAAVPDREIDLRPRRAREETRAASLGGIDPSLDVSPYVALLLLALFAAELGLRVAGRVAGQRAASDAARAA
jgi:hypothetical protein